MGLFDKKYSDICWRSEGMRKMGKAVVFVALLSVFGGLFGCQKTHEYTIDDIRSVSVTCGHMDYSHSYSFYLRKSGHNWLLDAEYAVDTERPRIEYEERPVTEKDAKKLLSVVQEQDVIGKIQRCKKPRLNVQIADETSYYTAILLADGEQLGAPVHISDDMVTVFYNLAGKYAGDPPETDGAE